METSTARRVLGLAVLLGAPVVAGCGTSGRAPAEPSPGVGCDDPRPTTLGVPTVRRPARLTTSDGRLQLVVRSLPSGSVFGQVDDTEVQLGQGDDLGDARYRVTASLTRPGVVDVEAGTYWVLNTNRGEIDAAVCPDVTLSEVEVALPEHPEPQPGG